MRKLPRLPRNTPRHSRKTAKAVCRARSDCAGKLKRITDMQILESAKKFCTDFTDDELCFNQSELIEMVRSFREEW